MRYHCPRYKWAVTREAFQLIKFSEWFCRVLSPVIHFETNLQSLSHGGWLSMSTFSCVLQHLAPSESTARGEDQLPSSCFSSKNVVHCFIFPLLLMSFSPANIVSKHLPQKWEITCNPCSSPGHSGCCKINLRWLWTKHLINSVC